MEKRREYCSRRAEGEFMDFDMVRAAATPSPTTPSLLAARWRRASRQWMDDGLKHIKMGMDFGEFTELPSRGSALCYLSAGQLLDIAPTTTVGRFTTAITHLQYLHTRNAARIVPYERPKRTPYSGHFCLSFPHPPPFT